MVADKWLLVLEIPILWFLVRSIRGRIARLNARIDEVKEEEARNPGNPYQAMFDALDNAGGPAALPKTPEKNTKRKGRSSTPPQDK